MKRLLQGRTNYSFLPPAKPADHGADRDCGGDADQGQKVHPAEDQRRKTVCPTVRGRAPSCCSHCLVVGFSLPLLLLYYLASLCVPNPIFKTLLSCLIKNK